MPNAWPCRDPHWRSKWSAAFQPQRLPLVRTREVARLAQALYEVYAILYEDKNPAQAVQDLVNRDIKPED